MNSLLKIVGILGGGTLVVTAMTTPAEIPVIMPSNQVVQVVPVDKVESSVKVEPLTAVEIVSAVKPVTIEPNKPTSIPEKVEVEKVAVPLKIEPKTLPLSKPKPLAEPKPVNSCHPGYSGCLKMNAGDYDCAGGSGNGPNYTGPVEVYGSDPFDLDRDNDGWGCDR